MDTAWPHRSFYRGATKREAVTLARELTALFGSDVEQWLEPARVNVVEKEVEGDHGLSGLCIPMSNNMFRFVYYLRGLGDKHRAFIFAHEIAHTFFYHRSPTTRPQRAVRRDVFSNDSEETFCDDFAMEVTGATKADVRAWDKSQERKP